MEEIDFSKAHDEHIEDEAETSMLSKKLVSLVLGAVVLVLLIAGGIYALTRPAVKQTAKNQLAKVSPKTDKKNEAKTPAKPTPTAKPNGLSSAVNGRSHTDATFGYSVKHPEGWEAYVRAGDETAKQIALHPVGSSDVPVTVNAQSNTSGITVEEFIAMQYGANQPRETKTIGGKNALMVRNDAYGYNSYFVANGSNMYEIAVTTLKPEYNSAIEQILSSFRFTNAGGKGGL